jgi:hypothetical protein
VSAAAVLAGPAPGMPRLPRRLTVRPRHWLATIQRADHLEARWEQLRELADEETQELMLRLEEREE